MCSKALVQKLSVGRSTFPYHKEYGLTEGYSDCTGVEELVNQHLREAQLHLLIGDFQGIFTVSNLQRYIVQ